MFRPYLAIFRSICYLQLTLLTVDSILNLRWPSTAETCRHRRTNKLRYLDSCVLTDLPTLINILLQFSARISNVPFEYFSFFLQC